MRRIWWLLLMLAGCSTVYVLTGKDSKVTSEREVSQQIGRGTRVEAPDGTRVDDEKEKAKDKQP